jgi:hypothetical protein
MLMKTCAVARPHSLTEPWSSCGRLSVRTTKTRVPDVLGRQESRRGRRMMGLCQPERGLKAALPKARC